MLEIPEAYVMAQQLSEVLPGKCVQQVFANHSPHKFAWFDGDAEQYHDRLVGHTIVDAIAHAGMVEIRMDGISLLFTDGVNIRFFYPGDKLPVKHQLHIVFDDDTSLVCSVQMYGGLWAMDPAEYDNPYYVGARDKPSPLTKDFTLEYFQQLWDEHSPKLSAKAFLATEQRIPGLGNGVLQDILYRASIHPKRKLQHISDDERDTLYHTLVATLHQMTAQGGRNTEKDLFGCSGGYATMLSSKTKDQPCGQCGASIVKQAYMGGSVYFCPTCQPLE